MKGLFYTNMYMVMCVQVTANNSISLAQFDYAVKFEEEYREAIASGRIFQIAPTMPDCFESSPIW